MKFILSFFCLLVLGIVARSQNFYQLPLKDVDGNAIALNSFAGKKILFFIVPINQADNNYSQLVAFKSRYRDTVKIIGIPSFEDGYQTANVTQLKSLYSDMNILLTEGMYTKKISGATQSALAKWLTDRTKNMHYDMDCKGIGQKFFVSELGTLFAVMPPQTLLNEPIIDRIVHSPIPH